VTKLYDSELLAKLAMSDMHALGVRYHGRCLTELYNRERAMTSSCSFKDGTMPSSVALAEVITFINEMSSKVQHPVFKLSELSKMYQSRISDSKLEYPLTHSTRLKETLLETFPDLRASICGKEVYLARTQDIGNNLALLYHQTSINQETLVLANAADIVRKGILIDQEPFDGTFSSDSLKRSSPTDLEHLVKMILEGPDMSTLDEPTGRSNAVQTICQLVTYNSVKTLGSKNNIRHNAERETPLPIYNAFKSYVKTRKKDLIDQHHKLGLSISYDRTMQIASNIANSVCLRYGQEGLVCPGNLRKNVFTTGALDNLDWDPSSTTATGSFHGTAISVVNHVSASRPGDARDPLTLNGYSPHKTIGSLPDEYTVVPPAFLRNKSPIVPRTNGPVTPSADAAYEKQKNDEEEREWLKTVTDLIAKEQLENNDMISWAGFHSLRNPELRPKATMALMPLFSDYAQSPAMVKHGMNITKGIIQFLNPGQTPVITMDQPLYSIAKQLQWDCPETLGEDKYVIMLGGLHTEMVILKTIGDWLDGSGWTDAINLAKITTAGRAEALISASNTARTRYVHQVTLATLHQLQLTAFTELKDCSLSFDEWCKEMSANHPQFRFWDTVKKLELILCQFIKSLRTGNFELYVNALNDIMPWICALDHGHYARWLPVHIRDMVSLKETNTDVYNEFKNGKFVVQRSERSFSSMALDQAHEQLNKDIKGDGGAIGLMENPTALRRWMLAGPELARIIGEYEDSTDVGPGSMVRKWEIPSSSVHQTC
jgi:hypothetical protein